MLLFLRDNFAYLMSRGGPVMWPLLGLSVLAVTLIFERAWFWLRTNNPARLARLERTARLMRQGDERGVRALVDGDTTVYGRIVAMLLSEPVSDALATDAVESQRPRMERFMPMLSTVITAAPMLGILGTVIGIINSFEVLSAQATAADPRSVGQGIAEALITTAAGLVVALVVLFPYNAYKAQIDRTLGRIEMLVAAAERKTAPANPSASGRGPG